MPMRDPDHLDWPFFDDRHRALAADVDTWAQQNLRHVAHDDVDATCRALVVDLGRDGWLRWCVPAAHGGAIEQLDSRALCVIRETLAYREGLADFAFAMQGLGSGAITLAGSDAQRRSILPQVAAGSAIMAFALSEPEAGSDVGALSCRARRDADTWVLNGAKTWISNGGIADYYTVFARSDATATGTKGISAFIVPAATPGLHIAERIDVIAPHPLARLAFEDCRVPAANLLGVEGEGFKLAMATLDIFRASVAAAAVGFARRALDEALVHARSRVMFGARLADLPVAQAKLADMATAIDAAALLTYRAAWMRDVQGRRTTREAAMAKMTATESAQRVIDDAVQLFGGLGVRKGSIVERLYREIRSLRIYEGATDVQKLVVARDLLRPPPRP
jgi:alkylation response protein AidB-like acyl-CoA dehydrogenase